MQLILLEDMYNFSELKNKIIIFSKETVENNVAAVIKPRKVAKVSAKLPKKRLAVQTDIVSMASYISEREEKLKLFISSYFSPTQYKSSLH